MSDKNPLSKIAATAPEHIWLDLGEEAHLVDDRTTFKDLAGVTWSEDNATGQGIKYLRADTLYHPDTQAGAVQAVERELLEYIDRMLTNLQPHIVQACLPGRAGFIDNYIDPVLERVRAALAATQPSAAPGDGQGETPSAQAYMCQETEVPCSRCKTACEAKAPAAEVTDEQIAALKARFGVTSSGRGIREFTQVKDFALAVASLAAPGTATAAREQEVDPEMFLDAGLADVQDESGINTYYSKAAVLECIAAALASRPEAPAAPSAEPFQPRVKPWLLECFGKVIANDREERNHRFLEEALELVQACGCTASEAHQLVDYTFGRAVGEKTQEVGGVMVTLAALCLANDMDMHAEGETELMRISVPAIVAKIRAKQAAKPKHSPLPIASEPQPIAGSGGISSGEDGNG